MSLEQSGLEESFLTVAEVAAMLKLNQQTVRNWIDQGSLPALRIGRRVRIRRSDLERVLEQGSTAPAGATAPAVASAQDEGPGAEGARPPYELRPGTGRRGPEELWMRFDEAVASLNQAITGSNAATVADAFGELSEAAGSLAAAVAQEDQAAARQTSPRARGA